MIDKKKYKLVSIVSSITILVLSLLFCIYLYKNDLLSDSNKLRQFVDSFNGFGPLMFILIEISQAVFPLIPGGLGLLAGVVLFGKINGFIYNYIGICLGSIIAFYVGRNAGRPLIETMFSKKSIERFDKYTTDTSKFTKIFAWLVVLPGAPDDLLCYLAGTTQMTWSTYLLVILLGKIPSISLYSLGIYYVFEKLIFH